MNSTAVVLYVPGTASCVYPRCFGGIHGAHQISFLCRDFIRSVSNTRGQWYKISQIHSKYKNYTGYQSKYRVRVEGVMCCANPAYLGCVWKRFVWISSEYSLKRSRITWRWWPSTCYYPCINTCLCMESNTHGYRSQQGPPWSYMKTKWIVTPHTSNKDFFPKFIFIFVPAP